MQAILKHCMAVLGRFIFIGFSVQIVLGILWMCNAFAGFNGPGEGIVCVGASILFGASVWFAKRGIFKEEKRWKDVFVLLSVLSFPFVMQSLVRPDVRLIMTSLILVLVGGACRLLDKLCRSGKKAKQLGTVLASFVLVVLLMAGTDTVQNGWTPVSARLTERVVWTTLYDTYVAVPKKIRSQVKYARMVNATYEATGMRDGLIPFTEEYLGEESAGEVFAALRSKAWSMNKKQIVKEICWDVAGYSVSPVVAHMQLAGRAYDSYTGMNYRELLLPAPKLGKIYMDYSCWWFGIGLVSAGLIYVMRFWADKKRPVVGRWVFLSFVCAGMVICYALDGAGRMDYKNTLFVLCIWLLWMAGGVQDAKD